MNPLNGLIVILTFLLISAQSTEAFYRFIPDDIDLVSDCQNHPNFGGVSDLVDLTAFDLSYDDLSVHAKGTIEIVWDVEENDRISTHCELKKFFRGTWQPTTFLVIIKDVCEQMKDTTSILYDVWTKHIISEDIHCPAKGSKYVHEQYLISVDFNVSGINMEGRYKIVSILRAYDETNQEKANAICIEFLGDIIKSQRVTMNSLNVLIVVFAFATVTVQRGEALYRFIPEDVDLFRDCQHQPKLRGINDFLNLSDFGLSYNDEGIHTNGTIVVVWDVEENDRISVHCELKKFVRGTWQPTMFSVIIKDLCKQMKDTTSIVYDAWTRHITSKDIHCLAKGRKYVHEPYSISVDFNVSGMNMEGRYKIVGILRAYDEKNREKANAICSEVPGDIIKVGR
uniref:MD-2-related lipid-recognition domain-containing protein n=1 Tax=Glossina palpalis gambiensis TaxID=67801 RepID=A0A1B0B3G2_9MUSC